MLVVYRLRHSLMGFSHPVSDSVLYMFNTIADTNLQEHTLLSNLKGLNSCKDEAKEAV